MHDEDGVGDDDDANRRAWFGIKRLLLCYAALKTCEKRKFRTIFQTVKKNSDSCSTAARVSLPSFFLLISKHQNSKPTPHHYHHHHHHHALAFFRCALPSQPTTRSPPLRRDLSPRPAALHLAWASAGYLMPVRCGGCEMFRCDVDD